MIESGLEFIGVAVMMPKPESTEGCPPGLEYLTQIDQVLIQQEVFALEGIRRVHGGYVE